MTGACIIDTVDIATLGMFIVRGGDNDFIAFPERRDPVLNEWFESDGVELDFDSLTFKPKTIKVEYYISAPDSNTFKSNLNAFENLHYKSGNRQIFIREFNHTFNLQFVGVSSYKHKGGLFKTGKKSAHITIEYKDNNPCSMFSPDLTLPVGGTNATRVMLNGKDMADYGIIIQEFYNTALQIASPKKGIVQESAYSNTSIVDTAFVPKKEARQFNMECTLLADTIEIFWNNYTALFNELAKLEAMVITLSNGEQINCYYSAMTKTKKVRPFNRKIQLSFTLKFNEV